MISVARDEAGGRRTHRYGARGLLVDLHEGEAAHAFASDLRESAGALASHLVEGEGSVLVSVRDAESVAPIRAVVDSVPHAGNRSADPGSALVTVPTAYDGEDLAAVADALGMSVSAFVEWHTDVEWTVALEGFAAGFSYLRAPTDFALPRRSSPRARVPAGSVALANHYSAVYPREHPSGWNLVGRTELELWDERREHPALLTPGRRVRFAAVRGESRGASGAPRSSSDTERAEPRAAGSDEPRTSLDAPAGFALDVIACRPGATVQDRGRPSTTEYSVSRAGAFDRTALDDGNRVLGNSPDRAGIEITNGGFMCRARGHQVVCLTGAETSATISDGDGTWPAPWGTALALNDGDSLTIGDVERGVRTYLTVRGGIAVAPSLGSRSFDSHSRIGPSPVSRGDVLPVGDPDRNQVVTAPLLRSARDTTRIRVTAGPRLDSVGVRAFEDLVTSTWTVDPASSRTAIRLQGDPVTRDASPELPSEALVPGAIQLPPSSIPIVFGVDHPITGGYPVIAVAVDEDIDLLGQLRPGDAFGFEATDDRTQEDSP